MPDFARTCLITARHTARVCEAVTIFCGRCVAWLTLLMAVTVTVIVGLRLLAGSNSIALQESVTYMHALVIMLACAWTLREDGHVRVDIFYHRYRRVGKSWLNLVGTLFLLLPVAIFIVAISWRYVAASWAIKESSADAGGLPAIFLLKSLIIALGSLLIVQSLAELCKQWLGVTFIGEEPATSTPDDAGAGHA